MGRRAGAGVGSLELRGVLELAGAGRRNGARSADLDPAVSGTASAARLHACRAPLACVADATAARGDLRNPGDESVPRRGGPRVVCRRPEAPGARVSVAGGGPGAGVPASPV